jgi:hypothetical protein
MLTVNELAPDTKTAVAIRHEDSGGRGFGWCELEEQLRNV